MFQSFCLIIELKNIYQKRALGNTPLFVWNLCKMITSWIEIYPAVCEPFNTFYLSIVNKSLGRGSSGHLTYVCSCHGSIQVLWMTTNKHRKEIPTESLVSWTSPANGVSEPRLDLKKVWQKFVNSKSIENRLKSFRMCTQRD